MMLNQGYLGVAKPKKKAVQEAWIQYKQNGSVDARNQLIEAYLPIVKFHADRISAKIHHQTDAEDLMAAGVFGLMDAMDAFDFDRGIKFETFAAHRVRGAILDELRTTDWVPRLVRSRTAKVESVKNRLTSITGQNPTDDEIADEMGVDAEEFSKIRKDVGATGFVSLNQQLGETNSGTDRDLFAEDVLSDPAQENPLELVQRSELKDIILNQLSRTERLLIVLYYYEGMTMKEISLTFDISESRVCQLHSLVLGKLRTEMRRIKMQPGMVG